MSLRKMCFYKFTENVYMHLHQIYARKVHSNLILNSFNSKTVISISIGRNSKWTWRIIIKSQQLIMLVCNYIVTTNENSNHTQNTRNLGNILTKSYVHLGSIENKHNILSNLVRLNVVSPIIITYVETNMCAYMIIVQRTTSEIQLMSWILPPVCNSSPVRMLWLPTTLQVRTPLLTVVVQSQLR